jgi:hypothetical protein
MKNNKLKHNFLEKDNKIPSDFLQNWNELFRQTPNFIIETSTREWETISVAENIDYDVLRLRDGDVLDTIKKEMTIKIAEILYNNNFIETIEEDVNYGYNPQTKKITMRLNVEKR